MYKAIWAAIALTMAVSLGSHGKITGRIDDFVQDTNRNEVSASNTNAIAKALGTDPGERNIKYILLTLDTLYQEKQRADDEAGKIKSAEYQAEENAIDVISENGISYRLYLSSNRTVDSVKNLDSGEWPIQSNW